MAINASCQEQKSLCCNDLHPLRSISGDFFKVYGHTKGNRIGTPLGQGRLRLKPVGFAKPLSVKRNEAADICYGCVDDVLDVVCEPVVAIVSVHRGHRLQIVKHVLGQIAIAMLESTNDGDQRAGS